MNQLNLRKLFTDIITNPDNLSFSAKRVGGFICLFSTIGFGIAKSHEAMIVMAGLTVSFFGLTTLDNKTAVNAGNSDGKNP